MVTHAVGTEGRERVNGLVEPHATEQSLARYRKNTMDGRRAVSSRWSSSRSQTVFCCCAAAVVLLVVASVDGGDVESRCPDDGCAGARCPLSQEVCPLGLVPDRCGCCANGVCGLAEGQECDAVGRPCASNSECVKTVRTTCMIILSYWAKELILDHNIMV